MHVKMQKKTSFAVLHNIIACLSINIIKRISGLLNIIIGYFHQKKYGSASLLQNIFSLHVIEHKYSFFIVA